MPLAAHWHAANKFAPATDHLSAALTGLTLQQRKNIKNLSTTLVMVKVKVRLKLMADVKVFKIFVFL